MIIASILGLKCLRKKEKTQMLPLRYVSSWRNLCFIMHHRNWKHHSKRKKNGCHYVKVCFPLFQLYGSILFDGRNFLLHCMSWYNCSLILTIRVPNKILGSSNYTGFSFVPHYLFIPLLKRENFNQTKCNSRRSQTIIVE